MPLAIGVDVGGTKVAAGVVDDDGVVVAMARRATPSGSAAHTEEVIADLVEELRAAHPGVVAVGVGAAGWVSADRATVVYAPNLAWRDEPLRARVAQRVDVPVVVENDANAAAWAEHRFGAACDSADVVLVTVGTGIGTGLILGGALYRGGFGMAGEAGHMTLVPDGHECGCGRRGCWEQYASGTALVRLVREQAESAPERHTDLVEAADGDASAITGQQITEAARGGDDLALAAFDEVGRALGQGLADLVAVLDPAVLVIGGGVADAGELLAAPARAAFAEHLAGRGHRPQADVRLAVLGNAAGVVGAADLARRG